MDKKNITVSICMITYNHEPYIVEAIEGVMMQKTDFSIELVIGEDCSTDNTRKICLEYKEKYSDKINLLLPEKNLGMMQNFITTLQSCKGKYIALCEGDDYWTDPLKLQRQVDFLEQNPEYSMCFHNAILHYESDIKEDSFFYKIDNPREFSGIEIYKKWIVPTASVLFHKTVINSSIYRKAITNNNFTAVDIVLFLSAAENGKIYGMSLVMSVYRKHESGASFGKGDSIQNIKNIKHTKAIYRVFGKKYQYIGNKRISSLYYTLFLYSFSQHMYLTGICHLYKSILYFSKLFIHPNNENKN